MSQFKTYYQLTKPGIIRGNLLAALAGFLLAAQGSIDWWLLIAVLAGTSLIIASACVFNNYIDRDIDKLMDRTKNRALVEGNISGSNALVYATVLGLLGGVILALYTNALALWIGVIGFIFYVIFYGYTKRHSVHGTLVGSVSGAVPPVAGYVAVTNNFDMAALLLFAIMTVWQMPHFYTIAMYRLKDYTAAKIPVLPAVKGMLVAKKYVIGYIIAFLILCPLLTVFGYTGITYAVVMGLVGLWWLYVSAKGFKEKDETKWARKVFHVSLIVLLAFCLMLSVDIYLP